MQISHMKDSSPTRVRLGLASPSLRYFRDSSPRVVIEKLGLESESS